MCLKFFIHLRERTPDRLYLEHCLLKALKVGILWERIPNTSSVQLPFLSLHQEHQVRNGMLSKTDADQSYSIQ